MAQQRGAAWNYRQNITKFFESAQNKSYTILGLTFIALIIFGAFAIRPTIAMIIEEEKKVKEGQQLDAKMQEKIDALYSLQNQIYENKRKLELSESSFPDDPQIDTIIADADLIAQKYDLILVSLTPGEDIDSASLETLSPGIHIQSMRITLEGRRDNFQKFIKHMETLPREIYLTRISVTESEEGNYEKNILTTEAYYFYYED